MNNTNKSSPTRAELELRAENILNKFENLCLGKLFFLTTNSSDQKNWIPPFNPLILKCPKCDDGEIEIVDTDGLNVKYLEKIMDTNDFRNRLKELGSGFTMSECKNCKNRFYTGFEFFESSNGCIRTTFHSLIELI